jgi:hypothetical protein
MKDWKAEHDKVLGQMKELRADRDFYKDQYFGVLGSDEKLKDALKDLILKVLDR